MERITERNFEMMSGKYQKEQLEIEARLKEVTETLNDSYEKSQGVRDFLSLIRNYQGLKELDATIINALIDKILVSEREKLADGTVRQEIKIYYKFIGFVGELHITPTKRWTALKPKNCTVCGVEYVPSSGISKYCPACAKRIQREKSNESKRRSRERNRRACIELSAKNDRLIQITAFYGLRRSEALGLRWDAIDFERNTITIRHIVTNAKIDGKYEIVREDRAKTKSSLRSLPLVDNIREKLLALKEQQKENKRICGNCYNREYDGYVFVDVMGNIFNPRNLSSNFSKLLELKGLRHIRFHDLRHSCASLLLANDVPMKQIQEWLGHSDISTTANIYSHLDYKSKLTSANVMDNVLTLPETEAVGWQT